MTPLATPSKSKSVTQQRERSAYGVRSEHSFFQDLYAYSRALDRRRASVDSPTLRGRVQADPDLPDIRSGRINVDEAIQRLNSTGKAKFDLSSGGASALIPTGSMPDYLADLFQEAARNSATLAAALNARPLPDGHVNPTGTDLRVPAMSSGAAVGVQSSENTTTGIGNTDPVFTLATAPIGFASGIVNLSRQLLDRARPDDFIASELGRAAGERVDIQLVNGSGSSGQTRGLLNLSGVVSTTYTDASPVAAKLLSKLGSNYADISSATAGYGSPPDVLVLHPRRLAWASSQYDTANQPVVPNYLRLVNVVPVASVPVNLGAGTNEDKAIHVVSEAVSAFVDPPQFELFPEVLSSTLTVRARVLTRIALVAPLSVAVGVVGGTGFASPTFA